MNCHSYICGNKSGCSEFPRILTLMLAQQDAEQCIAEQLEVERVSAGDQAMALSWNRGSI